MTQQGSDACVFSLDHPDRRDEIKMYQIGRYMSSNEAAWRIQGHDIHEHFPPITYLHVHLPNGQRVNFDPADPNLAQYLLEPPHTTLTEWFKLNQRDEEARTLLYPDIPERYRWHEKKWIPRQKQANIGRVYTVSPRNLECFMVRLLLHNVRGAVSFEDLRTVDGELQETFHAACLKLGLLESDDHWRKSLEEAALGRRASFVRETFAVLIGFCEVSAPLELWLAFRKELSEDFLYQAQQANPEATLDDGPANRALIEIEEKVMNATNRPLSDFGLPSPDMTALVPINRLIQRETTYDPGMFFASQCSV